MQAAGHVGAQSDLREPIHWATKLAKGNSARVKFISATNISEEALLPLDDRDRSQVRETILQAGGKVLAELVHYAKTQGVDADSKLVHGKGWHEIIRQVQRDRHDLVIVGTRNVTGIRRMLFGNTAMKLVRHVPARSWLPRRARTSTPSTS